MIQSAQQRAAIEQQAQAGTSAGNIATVASVSTDGLTLILPGESTAGSKKYPYNHSYVFSAGQRVHIAREGGTIIAEYPLDGTASPVDLSNYYTKAQVDAQVAATHGMFFFDFDSNGHLYEYITDYAADDIAFSISSAGHLEVAI